jgi:hypothetical protein
MAHWQRLSGVVLGMLLGCNSNAESDRAGVLFRGAHAAEPTVPACKLVLPHFRTLVLRGADCSSRPLHECSAGSSAKALQSELHTMVERCHATQSDLRVGATFRDGCAEQIRLSAELPSETLRCLADALNAARLSCAEVVACALSEVSRVASN